MTMKNEHLSAVFDNEADNFEQRRLVDELTSDPALQNSWSRYALIGDVMREPTKTEMAMPSFLSGIQDKLDTEEEYSQIEAVFEKEKSAWIKPVTGFAMAATIAAIAVFSMDSFITVDTGSESHSIAQQVAQLPKSIAPQKTASIESPPVQLASTDHTAKNVIDFEQKVKMQRYLASHIQNASRRTIAPSMRVISYNYQ